MNLNAPSKIIYLFFSTLPLLVPSIYTFNAAAADQKKWLKKQIIINLEKKKTTKQKKLCNEKKIKIILYSFRLLRVRGPGRQEVGRRNRNGRNRKQAQNTYRLYYCTAFDLLPVFLLLCMNLAISANGNILLPLLSCFVFLLPFSSNRWLRTSHHKIILSSWLLLLLLLFFCTFQIDSNMFVSNLFMNATFCPLSDDFYLMFICDCDCVIQILAKWKRKKSCRRQ